MSISHRTLLLGDTNTAESPAAVPPYLSSREQQEKVSGTI